MKYRIKKDGKILRLQQRSLFFFWYTLKHYVYGGGMYPIFAPNCYKTEGEAEGHAQALWGGEGERIRCKKP